MYVQILGPAELIECADSIKTQVAEMCGGTIQSCVPIQHLQKRLILFQHHIDQVLLQRSVVGSDDVTKPAHCTPFNKEELNKSNAKRKWYSIYSDL